MIDIHSHILPFVDDGAKNMDEAIEMTKIAYESGISTIIATPHYIENEGYNSYQENLKILDKLKMELKERNINVEILLGNELFITYDVFKLIDSNEIATLNNTKYLLIEFPRLNMPIYVENLIYNLKLKGIIPIIAHPERYEKVIEDPNILYNFIIKGALCQINLPSLNGRYGKKVKETAQILVKHKMIHFVASDAHSSRKATPDVRDSVEILESLIGSEKANKLLIENPHKLITSEDINICEPIIYNSDCLIKLFFKRILRFFCFVRS